MNLRNQEQQVYDYLIEYGEASIRELLIDTFVNSPTKVISDLRRKGIQINDRWKKTASGKRFKVYSLA